MSCPFRIVGGRAGSFLSTLTEDDLFRAHGREELADANSQAFLYQRVIDPIGIPTFPDQSCILEHTEVPRYGRGADRKSRGDLTGSELAALKILENLAPRRVGERPEYSGVIVHSAILANVLITIEPQLRFASTLEQHMSSVPTAEGRRLPPVVTWTVPERGAQVDQPGTEGWKVVMPMTGAFIGVPPIDPSKGALPNENTPPSAAASQ